MPAAMTDADVDALEKEAVDWFVQWNPIFATYLGIHDHDRRMPSGTLDAAIAEVRRYTYWSAYQVSYLLGAHLIAGCERTRRRAS